MYELCKKCMYENSMDVCIRCFNYSSYRHKNDYVRIATHNPYHMWPKEIPHISFTESYKKDEDILSPNDVRDIYVKTKDFGKEFDEFIKKHVKELKEKENMKDFRIDEITTTYEDGEYKFEIICRSAKPVFNYINNTDELTRRLVKDILNRRYGVNAGYGITRTCANPVPTIKDVRFNGPATIVFWEDGTKTVVKAVDEDVDYEKGLAMAIAKKALGNKGKYFNEFKKWLPEEEKKEEPNSIGKAVNTLIDEQGATFECTIDDPETFKKLIGTTDDGKTFNISFEAAQIVPVDEPKKEVSKNYHRYVHICKYRSSGYGNHGDDHTTVDEYCNYEGNRGEYCRGETCPRWNKEKDDK